jgi:hypothetical protein
MWFYNTYFGYKFADITRDLDNLKRDGIRVLGFFCPYYLSEDDDDDTIKLCRIQYLGDDEWAFVIWQASSDSYADAILLNGQPSGHPNQALDTTCTLYLTGTSDQPAEPLKDLRGAALEAVTQLSGWPGWCPFRGLAGGLV